MNSEVLALALVLVLQTERRWLASHSRSPKTNAPLEHTRLTPNHALRCAIVQFKDRQR